MLEKLYGAIVWCHLYNFLEKAKLQVWRTHGWRRMGIGGGGGALTLQGHKRILGVMAMPHNSVMVADKWLCLPRLRMVH